MYYSTMIILIQLLIIITALFYLYQCDIQRVHLATTGLVAKLGAHFKPLSELPEGRPFSDLARSGIFPSVNYHCISKLVYTSTGAR